MPERLHRKPRKITRGQRVLMLLRYWVALDLPPRKSKENKRHDPRPDPSADYPIRQSIEITIPERERCLLNTTENVMRTKLRKFKNRGLWNTKCFSPDAVSRTKRSLIPWVLLFLSDESTAALGMHNYFWWPIDAGHVYMSLMFCPTAAL